VAYSNVDDVFRALADPTRRALLDSLNGRGGQSLRELSGGLGMSRQSVSKHLGVLERSRLIATVTRGREKLHYLNPGPIGETAGRWIGRHDRDRVDALAELGQTLEQKLMPHPEFVYVSYIRTTARDLYRALTEPELTRRYWGVEPRTSWERGAEIVWCQGHLTQIEPRQVVLEADPGRRLAFTWHAFSAGWNALSGYVASASLPKDNLGPLSCVSFDLEARGELVKLSLLHDNFGAVAIVPVSVRDGWPAVISALKSLLETGRSVPVLSPESAAAPAGQPVAQAEG